MMENSGEKWCKMDVSVKTSSIFLYHILKLKTLYFPFWNTLKIKVYHDLSISFPISPVFFTPVFSIQPQLPLTTFNNTKQKNVSPFCKSLKFVFHEKKSFSLQFHFFLFPLQLEKFFNQKFFFWNGRKTFCFFFSFNWREKKKIKRKTQSFNVEPSQREAKIFRSLYS